MAAPDDVKKVVTRHALKKQPMTFVMPARRNDYCHTCWVKIPYKTEVIHELQQSGKILAFCSDICWMQY